MRNCLIYYAKGQLSLWGHQQLLEESSVQHQIDLTIDKNDIIRYAMHQENLCVVSLRGHQCKVKHRVLSIFRADFSIICNNVVINDVFLFFCTAE